ncbi:MAG: hypothetical protein CMJ18_22745 [Phycisphaeraceae bacterium]|nr:hypothetical protein [Phycisphaeraceae bacterium]
MVVAAILVPSVAVLWFLDAALHNDSLAIRQKLTGVYRQQLTEARGRIEDYWSQRVDADVVVLPAAERFATLVRGDAADAVIVLDSKGAVAYPRDDLPGTSLPTGWGDVERIEFEEEDFTRAAEAYDRIAREALNDGAAALAQRARARCLRRLGRRDDTLRVLEALTDDPRYAGARDPQGRLIAPGCLLLLIEMLDADDNRRDRALAELTARLEDYVGAAMPASQRRFLMNAVAEAAPWRVAFDTQAAESMAVRCAAQGVRAGDAGRLERSVLPGTWQMAVPGAGVILLFDEHRLTETILEAALAAPPAGATVSLAAPGAGPDPDEPLIRQPAAAAMPGWELRLHLDGDPFAAAIRREKVTYVAAAALGIVSIAAMGLFVGRYVTRQTRLARLRNDMIATVSHELRTPLASMRMLVDTLVNGRTTSEAQEREYLGLISGETERLSRLIDNFLAFSRMERNKRAFEFRPTDVGDIVQTAVEALRQRGDQAGFQPRIEVADGLPPVAADAPALVTVVLNLLDNALKYTGPDKHIRIAARADEGRDRVLLSVEDNGVGMTRRTARRIFDRFYQADQRLARTAGGCGLGLSIVRFIVDAHGGTISVDSEPGRGSTFTVALPAAERSAERGDPHG